MTRLPNPNTLISIKARIASTASPISSASSFFFRSFCHLFLDSQPRAAHPLRTNSQISLLLERRYTDMCLNCELFATQTAGGKNYRDALSRILGDHIGEMDNDKRWVDTQEVLRGLRQVVTSMKIPGVYYRFKDDVLEVNPTENGMGGGFYYRAEGIKVRHEDGPTSVMSCIAITRSESQGWTPLYEDGNMPARVLMTSIGTELQSSLDY